MKKILSKFKIIGKVLLAILAVLGVVLSVVKVRKAILGMVKSRERVSFTIVPGDFHKIKIIKKNGSTKTVPLPDGVEFKEVVAAGINENNEVVVEVTHEKVDRRNPGPGVDDNALDGLRGRVRPSK